jgi:glycosyltransferase involved in cell wall biosynthesis
MESNLMIPDIKPLVSIILPCRNEERFLGACLDSILASEYPPDRIEILIADGRSTDGTRELVASYARTFRSVRLVDNPARVTPAGLNRAIEASRGEIIVRLDAHSTIAPDYLTRAVIHLQQYGADNVGGAMRTVARDRGWFAKAISLALSHPFGVGNSHFRTEVGNATPRWVDTVFGGCWRREVFDRVGKFNERLTRGQDMEFNLRLVKSGGKILLAPDMRSYYFARATYLEFLKHNWTNGVWAVLPFAYSTVVPVRPRHLIPMVFALALAVASCAASLGIVWPLMMVLIPYLVVASTVATGAAREHHDPSLLVLLPITFVTLHLAYGAGSLCGASRLAGVGIRRIVSRAFRPWRTA